MEIIPFISFILGVMSILSPCILPILPIFVGFSLKTKSKLEIFSFTCGLFSIFVAVIFLTAFFTATVYEYINYFRLISAILLIIIGIVMLLNYSFSFKSISHNNFNSFGLGFLTSIAWAPCYGGYLISLIALLVSSNDVAYATFNIIVYALGFALTLLVLSLLISKINIDKLVSKTNILPNIFGILIIIGGVYLFLTSLLVIF